MDIGGRDYIVETTYYTPSEAKALVRGIVADRWPNAVYEDVEMGLEDVFVYEDEAAKKLWDGPASLAADMIYVLFRDGEITFVCDPDRTSEMIVKEVLCKILTDDARATVSLAG